MDDRPVEQGEGCQVMPRTTDCAGPTYLWHNYDPDNFNATELDWDVFTVPDVCQETTEYCLFPDCCQCTTPEISQPFESESLLSGATRFDGVMDTRRPRESS